MTAPIEIEHLFKQKQIKRSTGTTDRRAAEAKQHEITAKIYAEFDAARAKEEHQQRTQHFRQSVQDREHALDIMQILADVATEADGENQRLDVRQLVRHESRYRNQVIGVLDSVASDLAWGATSLVYKRHPKYDHIVPLAQEYCSEKMSLVVDQWRRPEDRLAAIMPGKPADLSEAKDVEDDQDQSEPPISDFLHSYLAAKKWENRKIKSKNAAERQIRAFIKSAEDPCITTINKKMAYNLAEQLEAEGKSNSLIKSTISAVSSMLTWCEQQGIIEENPLVNLSLVNYGTPTEHYKPFEPTQLHALFALDMPVQERLLLEILTTTGMRLDEAALLTWEQIKEHEGIRYFDLSDAIVKNKGSARLVAIPDCLTLPERGKGRLFNYRLDSDGKASNRASRVLGELIDQIPNRHRRQVLHSLRGTLKDLLRDVGVSKETNDFITGHSGSDVASNYGSGPSLKVKYDAVNRVKHPWLAARAR